MRPNNYCLVIVSSLVWNGFKGIDSEATIVANCASIPNDPNEIDRKTAFDQSIPCDWEKKYR